MNAVMTVDLSELDAWSAQVQRASDDLSGIASGIDRMDVQTALPKAAAAIPPAPEQTPLDKNMRAGRGLHSLHEIALHLCTWFDLAREALEGKPLPSVPFAEDWPEAADADWTATLDRMRTAARALVNAVEELREEDLGRTVAGRDYSIYVMLHGVAQHNAYHGGQIALTLRLAGA